MGLQELPPLDRRRLMEALLRSARLSRSLHPGIVAIVAHGDLAGRADADGVPADLLFVVEDDRLDDYASGARLMEEFAGLPIEVRIEVESRSRFRQRAASGDPELAAVRDRAVVLEGALPLHEIRPW